MTDLVFFYGTLMTGFERPGRAHLQHLLTPIGRGSIGAALFDLGFYPAAVPADDAQVVGEVHRMADAESVLSVLDEIEVVHRRGAELQTFSAASLLAGPP